MTKKAFSIGEYVVYPTHGVGQVVGFEYQDVAGYHIELMVITFEKDKMLLRIPVPKAKSAGVRPLSSHKDMQKALSLLRTKVRSKRAMWSRRAQEYETKINSGDPSSIAEVVRELYRNGTQPDQSYSERQIYQEAVDRLVRELAAVEEIDLPAAV